MRHEAERPSPLTTRPKAAIRAQAKVSLATPDVVDRAGDKYRTVSRDDDPAAEGNGSRASVATPLWSAFPEKLESARGFNMRFSYTSMLRQAHDGHIARRFGHDLRGDTPHVPT